MRTLTAAAGPGSARPGAAPAPGLVLAGKYRLVSIIGRGGMGTVWRGEHLELAAPVAIKILDASLAGDEAAMRQCRHEARAAAALRSPHVVQVLDFGRDDATATSFIVMELLEGESLADRLTRVGRLAPADTSRVISQVARALWRAHEAGIVHRDLKPANVFLVRNDDEESAKVLDFGTARIQRAGALSESGPPTGAVVGTPYYMSPEHISGGPVDHRTDLWALAVMACECLVGRRPFDATEIGRLVLEICTFPIPQPSRLAPVPPGVDEWFARATQRDPERRFFSARELADELRRACGGAGDARDDPASIRAAAVVAPPAFDSLPPAAGIGAGTAKLAWTAAATTLAPPPAADARARRRGRPRATAFLVLAVAGGLAAAFPALRPHSGAAGAGDPALPAAPVSPPPSPSPLPVPVAAGGPAPGAALASVPPAIGPPGPAPAPAVSRPAGGRTARPRPLAAGEGPSRARQASARRAGGSSHPTARHERTAPRRAHSPADEPSPSVESVLDQRR